MRNDIFIIKTLNMNIKQIKQLIREEVKKSFKGMLNEQDEYQFYIIKGNQVPTIKIAVKGNAIYSVVADKNTGKFTVGTQIGGGSIENFQKNPTAGVYAEGAKFVSKLTQYPSNYFTQRPQISNYGFVFDSNGKPGIVGLEASSKKPVFTIAVPEAEGDAVPGKVEIKSGGSSTTRPLKIEASDAFVVNKTVLKPEKSQKIKYFADALIRNAGKLEKEYVVITSASADKSTSIEDDKKLSQDRANTVANYLNTTLKEYGYSFKAISLGQTAQWAPETKYKVEAAVARGASQEEINALYNQSAPNRKLLIFPKSTWQKDLKDSIGNK